MVAFSTAHHDVLFNSPEGEFRAFTPVAIGHDYHAYDQKQFILKEDVTMAKNKHLTKEDRFKIEQLLGGRVPYISDSKCPSTLPQLSKYH